MQHVPREGEGWGGGVGEGGGGGHAKINIDFVVNYESIYHAAFICWKSLSGSLLTRECDAHYVLNCIGK